MANICSFMRTVRRQNFSCSLLRFLAIALIVNSHMGDLYLFPMLAVGGAIGNAIFFFASGYSLFLSNRDSFFRWEFRRITRIYPSLWLFMIITGTCFGLKWSFVDAIIPRYWFLTAILIFYPLFFFVLKYFEKFLFGIILVCIVAMVSNLYFFNDFTVSGVVKDTVNPTYLHYFIYFPVMLAGALYAKNRERLLKIPSLLLLGMIPMYFVAEVVFGKVFPSMQVVIPLFLLVLPTGFERLCAFVPENKIPAVFKSVIALGGRITLDVYIVQKLIIKYFTVNPLPVHLTVPVAIAAITASACMLYFVSSKISNFLRNIPFKRCV